MKIIDNHKLKLLILTKGIKKRKVTFKLFQFALTYGGELKKIRRKGQTWTDCVKEWYSNVTQPLWRSLSPSFWVKFRPLGYRHIEAQRKGLWVYVGYVYQKNDVSELVILLVLSCKSSDEMYEMIIVHWLAYIKEVWFRTYFISNSLLLHTATCSYRRFRWSWFDQP